MNIVDIYNEIVEINEKVMAGTFTIQQAHVRIQILANEAKELGTVIDVLAIMGSIEAELLESQDSENDDWESSESASYDDYEEDTAS